MLACASCGLQKGHKLPLQVYSGSRDGTLRLWDVASERCVRELAVREAVRAVAVHASLAIAYLSIEWREGHAGRVISFNLDTGRPGGRAMKTRSANPLAMNPRGGLQRLM